MNNIDQAIDAYFQNAVEQEITPTLHDFVMNAKDLIMDTEISENLNDFWSIRFLNAAKKAGVLLGKSKKIDWEALLGHDASNSNVSTENKTSKSPTTGTKRTRSATNSKTDSAPLTPSMLTEFKNVYKSLTEEQKWKLPNGKFVEDLMYEYGSNCEYEHAVHSFILDVDDPCLLKPEGTFTHKQMETIRSYGYPGLPYLSDSLKAMFNLCSKTVADAIDKYNERTVAGVESASRTDVAMEEWVLRCLTAKVRECGNFDPYEQCDEEWLQSVLLDFFRMYRWDVLSWVSTVGSEADLVSRVWSRLDECFYSLRMQTRRDHTSTAAAADANRDKTLTGMSPISAQQPSFRPDLVLFKNGIEFGMAECGKDDGSNGVSQKELVETQLHCPKLLKSMLLQVAAKCNNRKSAVRKLKTIGFAQFHLHMNVMIMDSPSGSVCRLSRTPSYRIATAPSLIQSGLLPILKLTLKCKEVVAKTIDVVESTMRADDEEPDVRSVMTKSDTVELPPVARFKEKKSKMSA